jgi:hypothetical protein
MQLGFEDWILGAAVRKNARVGKKIQRLEIRSEINLVLGVVVFSQRLCVELRATSLNK